MDLAHPTDDRTPCEERGYCGPFVNRERYAHVAGWEGMADCRECRNTVLVRHHEELRAEAELDGAESCGAR